MFSIDVTLSFHLCGSLDDLVHQGWEGSVLIGAFKWQSYMLGVNMFFTVHLDVL